MRIRDWINRGVGFGLLLSIILCIAGAALGALLMDKEILSVESQGYGSLPCGLWPHFPAADWLSVIPRKGGCSIQRCRR